MILRVHALAAVLACFLPVYAQTAFTLPVGTPVRLRLAQTISSADATAGAPVPFEVVDDVIANSVLVVPHGAVVTGAVAAVHSHGRSGKGGSLRIKLDVLHAGNGLRIPIGTTAPGVAAPATAMMAGSVSIPVPPPVASPLAVFASGADVSIAKGLELVVYTERALSATSDKLTAKPATAAAPAT